MREIVSRHLRACVELKLGQMSVYRLSSAEIGDDERVRACIIDKLCKTQIVLKLAVVNECVECDIRLSATGVEQVDGRLYFVISEILCIDKSGAAW